ncbi:MAG TPA: glycosyltransferase [Thermoleophilaceae bacterium]
MSLRICIISREYPPESAFGGIARAEHIAARALARAGADVHVITYSPRGLFTRAIKDGVVVHRLPAQTPQVPADMHYVVAGAWSLTVAGYYAALDSLVGFDVVHAQDYFGETLHLERRPETALVVRLHALSGVVSERSGRPRSGGDRGLEALETAALVKADLLLGPTQQVIDETQRFVGQRTPPVRALPLGMDFERFTPREAAPREGQPLRLLFLGRLEPLKCPELALYAAAAAKGRGLDVALTLVGRDIDGYRVGTLVPLMRELGLDFGDVRFVAEVDEAGVLQHIGASDCAILPSRFENFHMAAVEALACGVPVITSDRSGLSGWLAPDDGLLALPIEDAAGFGTQAAEALAGGWAAQTASRAQQRVRELFDADEVAGQQLAVYHELVQRLGAGAGPQVAAEATSKLGIVVLAHNALDYTQRALRSILRHTDTGFTVYLVDNASTDGTPDWATDFDPRVRLLRSEENLGVSGGRNVGIAAALADDVDHVVFLDNDVEVYSGWWQPFAAALEADRGAAIAGERGVRLHFHADGRNEETLNCPGPVEADMVVGFCMFMSADAMRQIGRFDENLGLFWHDDDDYCLRAKRLGFRVLHVGSGRLIHFEHKSSAQVDGIWESAEADAPSSLSADNQRYLAAKWRGDGRGDGLEGARGFVALAFGDELLASSELLAAWVGEFSGSDDATLAIYANGTPADELANRLASVLAAAGLDGDSGADLLLVQGGDGSEAAIAGSVDAVFTRRDPQGVFHAPAHFDDAQLDRLRALAERRWAALAPQAV